MPAHRKSSLERYIPPRRSIDQQHNGNTTPSPSGGKKGPPTTFAELADRSFEALSWNEEVELDQNMKNMYIGSWADETEKQEQENIIQKQQQHKPKEHYKGRQNAESAVRKGGGTDTFGGSNSGNRGGTR